MPLKYPTASPTSVKPLLGAIGRSVMVSAPEAPEMELQSIRKLIVTRLPICLYVPLVVCEVVPLAGVSTGVKAASLAFHPPTPEPVGRNATEPLALVAVTTPELVNTFSILRSRVGAIDRRRDASRNFGSCLRVAGGGTGLGISLSRTYGRAGSCSEQSLRNVTAVHQVLLPVMWPSLYSRRQFPRSARRKGYRFLFHPSHSLSIAIKQVSALESVFSEAATP
jgi:hypothetical protein